MRRKKNQILPILVLFVLFVGVVYAILQTDLQINGTTKIANNLWDVHFANIVVNSDSVSIGTGDSPVTIDSNDPLKVDFSVTLSLPGDFYEFTVDVVNSGTIDAMIGTLNKTFKVNNVLTETVPSYLNYTVTYDDGSEIIEKQILYGNSAKTIKARIEFKNDINAEDLPDATTLSMTIELTYVQADSTAIVEKTLYNVFVQETKIGLGTRYKGEHNDSFTKNATHEIYYWDGNLLDSHPPDFLNRLNIDEESSSSSSSEPGNNTGDGEEAQERLKRIVQNRSNVLFAGFCWQMYRTTDTGGVKLLYNGIPNNGTCPSNRTDDIGKSKFNNNSNSLSDVGYMYGTRYPSESSTRVNWYFAPDVSYENGVYTLTSKTINNTTYSVALSNGLSKPYEHYTCGSSTETSCTNVKYVYYSFEANNSIHYITLSHGKKVEDAVSEMLTNPSNENNSTIKTLIDNWYSANMTNYTNKLEDTIFCNDREVEYYGNWQVGLSTTELLFATFEKTVREGQGFYCTNSVDQFSVSNDDAKLAYPVGLMTYAESYFLRSILFSEEAWLMSPHKQGSYAYNYVSGLNSSNGIDSTDTQFDVRPVVSLKPGTRYISGDGSIDHPYVVE